MAIIAVPTEQIMIILAMDASDSMQEKDIAPSRLQAAEATALSFIQNQQAHTQIGLVAFAGLAALVQPPTNDREVLAAAVQSLTTGDGGAAMGSAILKSFDVIAEIDKDVAPIVSNLAAGDQPTPVPNGAYVADIIVLLTDGVNNAGPSAVSAAQQAVDRGVRIYTIGFGMANGASSSSGSSTEKDETTLKQVAAMTGGEYYSATNADELEHVFQQLPTYLITKHKTTEISVAFAAIGTFLATVAIGLSLRWHALP